MINEQTPGPLVSLPNKPSSEEHPYPMARVVSSGGTNVAFVAWPVRHPSNGVGPRKNAKLVAAAYSAFDIAARELGVDATELAEKMNLIEMIGNAAGTHVPAQIRVVLESVAGLTKHKS